MGSLGNEKNRWIKTRDRLGREKLSMLGDMIVSASFITYLGPFEASFRERVVKKSWRGIVMKQDILVGEKISLKETIGNPQQLQNWVLKGIPSDNVSFENMIIIDESKVKWPLIIDPQGQAIKFIKELLD